MVQDGAVDAEVRASRAVSRRDRDAHALLGWVGQEVPKGGGGSVAEDRARAACEEGSDLQCEARRNRVADEVDASVKAVKAASFKAGGDLAGTDPCKE